MNKLFRSAVRLSVTATAKDLYWMFGGNIVSIILAFAATIIIARFITQAEYGIFLALFSFSTMVAELSDFGINTSLSIFFPKLIKEKNLQKLKMIYNTAFNLEILIGILVLCLSFLFLSFLQQTVFVDVARIFLMITFVETFFVQLTAFAVMTQAAHQKFKEFAFVSVLFGVCRLVLILIFWYLGQVSLLNILLIQLASSILNVLFAQFFVKFPLDFSKFNIRNIREIFRFSGFMGVTKILTATSNRLDLLMLLPLAGATVTGVYGAASRIAQIYPFLVTGFGQVIAPKMAAYEGRESVPFLKKSFLVAAAFIGTMLVFYIFAQPIILVLFSDTYLGSIPVFKGLLIAMVGYVLSVPFTTLLVYTYKKPQIMTILVLIQLVIIAVGNIYLIPRFGGLGPIYSIAIANVVLLSLSGLTAVHYLREKNSAWK